MQTSIQAFEITGVLAACRHRRWTVLVFDIDSSLPLSDLLVSSFHICQRLIGLFNVLCRGDSKCCAWEFNRVLAIILETSEQLRKQSRTFLHQSRHT